MSDTTSTTPPADQVPATSTPPAASETGNSPATVPATGQVQENITEASPPVQQAAAPANPKAERHATQKIEQLSENSLRFARIAIEADGDAIYEIARQDPSTAAELLKEYDYGTESVQDLLAKKDGNDTPPANPEISSLREELYRERLTRLQEKHPALKEEAIERNFRSISSLPEFKGKSEGELISIASIMAGKPPVTIPSQIVQETVRQPSANPPTGGNGPQPSAPSPNVDLYRRLGYSDATIAKLNNAAVEAVVKRREGR